MLRHLRENVYCHLAPSSVHGVGVFAVRDIPKGTEPFKKYKYRPGEEYCTNVSDRTMRKHAVPEEVVGLVHQFFLNNGDRYRTYPVTDLNRIDISYYLNHDEERANTQMSQCANHANCQYDHLVTLRDILAGEELFLDYTKTGCPYDDKF